MVKTNVLIWLIVRPDDKVAGTEIAIYNRFYYFIHCTILSDSQEVLFYLFSQLHVESAFNEFVDSYPA